MRFIFLLSCLFPLAANASDQIRFVRPSAHLHEVLGAYSIGHQRLPATPLQVTMPYQRSFAGFGGLQTENNRIVCGPAPDTNTMSCFDIKWNASLAGYFPVPGMLSSTPVFSDHSWLIGTEQGFLMRVESLSEKSFLPALGSDHIALWGSQSRSLIASLKPKTSYSTSENAGSNPSSTDPISQLPHVKWMLSTSSAIVGKPLIKNGLAYIFSANQYFQAIDWNTGKALWSVRLAPDSTLKLNSSAAAVTDSEVILGNSFGTLLVLNPTDGSVLWKTQLAQANQAERLQFNLPAGPDRFPAIVAAPLISGRHVIVSNAESMTQCFDLDKKALLWSVPIGSVATPLQLEDGSIVIGSENGSLLRLDKDTGKPLWKTLLTNVSPITSLALSKTNLLLAATNRGQIFLIDPQTGSVQDKNLAISETNGEFFQTQDKELSCLSFAMDGFRCFKVQ